MKKSLTYEQIIKDRELRLSIYEKALEDYKLGDHPLTMRGFCLYFNETYGVDVYRPHNMEKTFPELYSQRQKWIDIDTFWFTPGDTASRVKCLENAIKMLKDEMEKEIDIQ